MRPRVIVALGVTAVQALLGHSATITSLRGSPMEIDSRTLLYATVHPSYLLRLKDPADKRAAMQAFDADLDKIRTLAENRT